MNSKNIFKTVRIQSIVIFLLAICLTSNMFLCTSCQRFQTDENLGSQKKEVHSDELIEFVTIPNLYGMTEEEAVETLNSLGLKADIVYGINTYGVEAGLVYSSTQGVVQEGSIITLDISSGIGIRVPDVIGWTEADAVAAIEALGVPVIVTYNYTLLNTAYLRDETPIVGFQWGTGVIPLGDNASVGLEVLLPAIRINYVHYYVNYANGVDITVNVTNLSDKMIKYIEFHFSLYNTFGDPIINEITRLTYVDGRYTGPLYSNETEDIYWRALFYNNTIEKLTISAKITFEDNTVQRIGIISW